MAKNNCRISLGRHSQLQHHPDITLETKDLFMAKPLAQYWGNVWPLSIIPKNIHVGSPSFLTALGICWWHFFPSCYLALVLHVDAISWWRGLLEKTWWPKIIATVQRHRQYYRHHQLPCKLLSIPFNSHTNFEWSERIGMETKNLRSLRS